MDINLSRTISFVRFPMIIGIVFIHSQNSSYLTNQEEGIIPITILLQNLLSDGICRIFVPLFFIISGYLFWVNTKWGKDAYIKKLNKRIHSLLIPYFLYILLALLIFGLMQKAMPDLISEGKIPIANYGLKEFVEAFWMYNDEAIPFVGPLWFIRDLMFLCIISPLIYVYLHLTKIYGIFFLIVLYLFNIPIAGELAFWGMGGYCAINNVDFAKYCSKQKWSYWIYPLILVLDTFTKPYCFSIYIHKVGVLVGILSFTGLCYYFVTIKKKSVPEYLSSSAFFIYCIHEPYFDQFRKVIFKILPQFSNRVLLDMEMSLLYMILPIIFVSFLILIYRIMKRVSPGMAVILSGGR